MSVYIAHSHFAKYPPVSFSTTHQQYTKRRRRKSVTWIRSLFRIGPLFGAYNFLMNELRCSEFRHHSDHTSSPYQIRQLDVDDNAHVPAARSADWLQQFCSLTYFLTGLLQPASFLQVAENLYCICSIVLQGSTVRTSNTRKKFLYCS